MANQVTREMPSIIKIDGKNILAKTDSSGTFAAMYMTPAIAMKEARRHRSRGIACEVIPCRSGYQIEILPVA